MVESRCMSAQALDKQSRATGSLTFAGRPLQELGTILLYSKSVDYLSVVGYVLHFLNVTALRKNKFLKALNTTFARHSIPEKARSNNGPPFLNTKYMLFATEWGFEISPSNPRCDSQTEKLTEQLQFKQWKTY